jgi:hypothetical protein
VSLTEGKRPKVRDLTTDWRAPKSPRGEGPPDLVLISASQLQAIRATAEEVAEITNAKAAIAFRPIGPRTYLGRPFCLPSDPELTCYPVSPGPDDNPFTWVCACTADEHSDGPSSTEKPPLIDVPACELRVGGGKILGMHCDNVHCKGQCHLVISIAGTTFTFACSCS